MSGTVRIVLKMHSWLTLFLYRLNLGATKGYNKSDEDSQLKVITSSTPQKVAFTVYVIGLLILTALSVTLVSIV